MLLALCACTPNGPVEPQYGPDVVLTVTSVTSETTVTITEAEVEHAAKKVEFAYEGASAMHYKRLALREIVLPRAAIRAGNENARTEALKRAREVEGQLVDGVSHADETVSFGDVDSFGPLIIGTMIDLVPNEWSEMLENLGSFQFIRIVQPATPELQRVELAIVNLTYAGGLATHQDTQRYMEDSVLEVLDPGYGDLVPTLTKHRMASREEQ